MLEEKQTDHSTPSETGEARVSPPRGNVPQNTGRHATSLPKSMNDSAPRRQYLKITCPSDACKHELVLACPYCQTGVLSCRDHHFVLVCDHCKNSLRAVNCNCGFSIRASYIADKERKLDQLRKAADPDAYRSIFTIFVVSGGLAFLAAVLGGH